MDADSAVSMDASDPPAFGGATGVGGVEARRRAAVADP